MVMKSFSYLQAIAVFVFLAHSTNIYVAYQIHSGSIHESGLYRIGETFRGICFAEIALGDNITVVDAYWKRGNTEYCHKGQKLLLNRRVTCNATTVHNRTTFELRISDLALEDAGIYLCELYTHFRDSNGTKSSNDTSFHEVTFTGPSITTPGQTPGQAPGGGDDTGGAASAETKLLSTLVIMLSVSLVYI